MLRPDATVQKILLSSTSRFVGEYESKTVLITHAWQQSAKMIIGMSENPYCRNYYIVAFKTSPVEKKTGILIPNYAYGGDFLCIYLSILFGKRFDNHGLIEGSGHFNLPDLGINLPIEFPNIGINNHSPRKDLGIELNFGNVNMIEKILMGEIEEDVANIITSAGRFYLRALHLFEEEPELAFLDLVTCGEILSNYNEYTNEELWGHDGELLSIFNEIENKLEKGRGITSYLKQRLYQVKRKYTLTLCNSLNNYFFLNTESKSKSSFTSLTSEGIEKRIKASYDLRSKYVHMGANFGWWLLPSNVEQNEICTGTPVGLEHELTKLIVASPNLLGMERIMRFCLLKFIHNSAVSIDSRLD